MWNVDLRDGEQSFNAEGASEEEARTLVDAKIPAGWIRIWNVKVIRRGDHHEASQIAAPAEIAVGSRSSRARVAAVRALAAGGKVEAVLSVLDGDQPGEVIDAALIALSDLGDSRSVTAVRSLAAESRWHAALATRVLTVLVRAHAAELEDDELRQLTEFKAADQASIAAHDRVETDPVDGDELIEIARAELSRRKA